MMHFQCIYTMGLQKQSMLAQTTPYHVTTGHFLVIEFCIL